MFGQLHQSDLTKLQNLSTVCQFQLQVVCQFFSDELFCFEPTFARRGEHLRPKVGHQVWNQIFFHCDTDTGKIDWKRWVILPYLQLSIFAYGKLYVLHVAKQRNQAAGLRFQITYFQAFPLQRSLLWQGFQHRLRMLLLLSTGWAADRVHGHPTWLVSSM